MWGTTESQPDTPIQQSQKLYCTPLCSTQLPALLLPGIPSEPPWIPPTPRPIITPSIPLTSPNGLNTPISSNIPSSSKPYGSSISFPALIPPEFLPSSFALQHPPTLMPSPSPTALQHPPNTISSQYSCSHTDEPGIPPPAPLQP